MVQQGGKDTSKEEHFSKIIKLANSDTRSLKETLSRAYCPASG